MKSYWLSFLPFYSLRYLSSLLSSLSKSYDISLDKLNSEQISLFLSPIQAYRLEEVELFLIEHKKYLYSKTIVDEEDSESEEDIENFLMNENRKEYFLELLIIGLLTFFLKIPGISN